MIGDRHSIIPAVWIIVQNTQNQVFLLRRANTGWRDGSWTVPAGHIEKDEGPTAAAIRELKEEVGLDITPEQLEDPLVYFHPEDSKVNERVSVFFILKNFTGTPVNAEPHKADKAGWFDLTNLPPELPPMLRQAFTDTAEGMHYSERYYDTELHKELLQ